MELDFSAFPQRPLEQQASFRFFTPGPVGRLETVLNRGQGEDCHHAVAVVCHPHPLYDGSMHNKVTYTLARTFNQQGVPALRFNFRGVGDSEGVYDQGQGETDDLLALIEQARALYPGREVWIAGFSFGAYIALRAIGRADCAHLFTIAPPVNFFDFSRLRTPGCPWLLVQGEADEIVPCEQVVSWAKSLRPGPELVVLPEVGHFFHRKLGLLRSVLEEHLQTTVAAPLAL